MSASRAFQLLLLDCPRLYDFSAAGASSSAGLLTPCPCICSSRIISYLSSSLPFDRLLLLRVCGITASCKWGSMQLGGRLDTSIGT